MSRQMSFADMFSATSSPGSADGPSPCSEQAGQKTDPSGREAARVSPSAALDSAGAWTTSGTSGPSGAGSLRSAGLSSALASRLADVVECSGSTLYAMTWRDTATPAGRYHPRLAVTALRTDESGSTGWPTPVGKDGDSGRRRDKAPGSHPGETLTDAASLWPTPTARDWKDGKAQACQNVPLKALLGRVVHLSGAEPAGSDAATASSASLNPAFSLWLMGFPVAWLCCGVRAMRLSYRRRKRSSGPTRIFRRTP